MGQTISASELRMGSATATLTYNGDTFFMATDGDSMFEDGEVVFQFVGITDLSGPDITVL